MTTGGVQPRLCSWFLGIQQNGHWAQWQLPKQVLANSGERACPTPEGQLSQEPLTAWAALPSAR